MIALLLAASIALLAPEDGAVYDTCPPQVREFLANPAKRIENPPAKDLGGFAVHNDWTMQLAQDCSRLVRKGEQPFRWSAESRSRPSTWSSPRRRISPRSIGKSTARWITTSAAGCVPITSSSGRSTTGA